MNSRKIKAFSVGLACMMTAGIAAATLAACGGDENTTGKVYDNETDPIVFSTLALDRVFNPFFYTTGPDGNVVGLTQISMLGNDKDGNVTYGDNEAVVVKDYEILTEGSGESQISEYRFVLKNNIKFSNGSPLTIKDVLFNLYVYLDPMYTGSSTIYSTDIVGLKAYRTQSPDDKQEEQDSFMEQFNIDANARVDALDDAASEIEDENGGSLDMSVDQFKAALSERVSDGAYAHLVEDFDKAGELFKKELETDYSNAVDGWTELTFTDEDDKTYKDLITSDAEMFLYNESGIVWNRKEGTLEYNIVRDHATIEAQYTPQTKADGTTESEEEVKERVKAWAIGLMFDLKFPKDISEIINYWMTASDLRTFIANQLVEEFYKGSAGREYKNIEGITFANRNGTVTVKGVVYGVPEYESDGSVKNGSNEVLSIKIHKIDPKAIWNFAFSVAPMYYYSTPELAANFNFEDSFGVEYASQTFMQEVVNSADKVGVPMGAGPYAASKSAGGIDNIKDGDFYDKGIVYYERNPYYNPDGKGAAKIKKLRYQVTSESQMLNSLYNKAVDFVEPNAKPETVSELNGRASEGIGNQEVQTSGYGYIGVNAGKVPSLAVRKAIMYSINTMECVNYYKTSAQPIYRSLSRSNWAYPENSTSYYPYIGGPVPEDLSVVDPYYKEFATSHGKKMGDTFTQEEQDQFIRELITGDGYALNSSGIYYKGTSRLDYRFTIVGDDRDHPAFQALWHAYELLDGGTNRLGFKIEVKTDTYGLNKLSTGDLTVWAAAWSSTIDPDMYQVYHKDSTATSTLNWGYKQILNNRDRYPTEYNIIAGEGMLSDLIEKARETNDQKERKELYSDALDLVMQLAVELPTYQRNDLFAYNTEKIDVSTFTPESDLTAYKGLTSNIHLVSLNVAK